MSSKVIYREKVSPVQVIAQYHRNMTLGHWYFPSSTYKPYTKIIHF